MLVFTARTEQASLGPRSERAPTTSSGSKLKTEFDNSSSESGNGQVTGAATKYY